MVSPLWHFLARILPALTFYFPLQVPPLLYYRQRTRNRLHLAHALVDLPTTSSTRYCDDWGLHAIHTLGCRFDRGVRGTLGTQRRIKRV